MNKIFFILLASAIISSWGDGSSTDNSSNTKSDTSNANTTVSLPDRKSVQDYIDGKLTDLYILKNKNDMTAAVTNYGGRLVGLWVPDKNL